MTPYLQSGFQKPLKESTMLPPPFKEDSTFEISQKQTPPDTPNELYHLEDHYLEKPSAHMWKVLHIMQYTHPDLLYFINRIYI